MGTAAGRATGPSAPSRGQSSVVGVVLVVAITVLGVTAIVLFGVGALQDAQTQTQVDAASHAMTQLDSRFSLVALGSADYQSASVDLSGGADLRVDGDAGWMNVSAYDLGGSYQTTVLNASLGSVVYENDGTTIAYQGGGVWERKDGGSTMISPPEFHYRTRSGKDPTLTLPLVLVRGNGSVGGTAAVESSQPTARYPVPGVSSLSNPLSGGKLKVTVHSRYYRAWGTFFESRTGGAVTYDDARERVSITLRVPQDSQTVGGGIVATGAGTLEFGNKGNADSYNSSDADYATKHGQNTSIVAAGDVELGQQTTIAGNLVSGQSVTMGQNSVVTGNVSYGGTSSIDSKATIGGTLSGGASVDTPDAIDWLIDAQRNALQSPGSNDNGGNGNVTSNQLGSCAPSCTLYSGDYYLTGMDLGNGEKLVLDTSGGPVNVVVDGDAAIENSGQITVTGTHTARIFLEGDLSLRQATVTVPQDRSYQMWFYMNPGASVTTFKQTHFEGVVYGPGGGAQPGVDIQIATDNDVYGGLVGVPSEIGQTTKIHFDEALVDENPLAGFGGSEPAVTYLHVSTNQVNVTAG